MTNILEKIKEKVFSNKTEIEEYIQNKECQNQIFHLANYFDIPIKDMIIVLNDNNIKLSHYKINSYKFSNKNLNNTFKEFSKLNNDIIFDFLKNNSFRMAEKEFESDRLNLKFWLDINGYDIFSVTNKKKVGKMIAKKNEKNIEDIIEKNLLEKIKEEIKKGTHWLILKEKFPELNQNERAWNRWFEKEKLKVNKDIKEEVKITHQIRFEKFEEKYKDFILEKIKEGYSKKDIRNMIINNFGESENYCPVLPLINKYFKQQYNDYQCKRQYLKCGILAKKDNYVKNEILLKEKIKNKDFIFDILNNEKMKNKFYQYCIQNNLYNINEISKKEKIKNNYILEKIYKDYFDNTFILNEKYFNKNQINIIFPKIEQMKKVKIDNNLKKKLMIL